MARAAASSFRRTDVVEGLELNALLGKTFRLNGILLEGSEECRPCYWMDSEPTTLQFTCWTGSPMSEKTLSNSLKVHRAMKDLTQEELAEMVAVTRKTINTIENRKYIPSTYLALKLAQALETSVEDLFQIDS